MSKLVKHFIKEPKVLIRVRALDISDEESSRLVELVTLLYHQKLLNQFLEHLEEEDKKIFLELVIAETDGNYLEFLHQRISNLEEIVEKAMLEIDDQISQDLDEIEKEN